MPEELARGAEAIILRVDGAIRKERPKKSYRHDVIDETLRKLRTRKEAKILTTLEQLGVPGPKLLEVNDKEGVILMSEIKGPKLRDVIETDISLCAQVGKYLATLHDNNIMHGDLTTSNCLVVEKKVFLIDFGLSFHSTKIEDRAVDLHLFKQALESKHHTIANKAWNLFVEGYAPTTRKEVLERLLIVEARGRNKV